MQMEMSGAEAGAEGEGGDNSWYREHSSWNKQTPSTHGH